jgi:macrolide transport system ATP-binding/permease protein
MAEPLIRVVDLKRTYSLGDVVVHALRGVTLDIAAGSFIAVVGASGSGKSTLMNILGLLDHPTSGHYFLKNRDVSGFDRDRQTELRNKKIGFVFQNFSLLPRTTTLENVKLPLLYNGRNHRPAERHAKAMSLLQAVLAERAHHTPTALRRPAWVAIARLRSTTRSHPGRRYTGNLDSRRASRSWSPAAQTASGDHGARPPARHRRSDARRDGPRRPDPGRQPVAHRRDAAAASDAGRAGGRRSGLQETPLALRAIRRNKVRSALTMLGVIIGVASVIAMIALGSGARAVIDEQIQSQGTTLIYLSAGS